MKTYSIGRDLSCDIVINDSTDVISRRHALLNVTPSGKMTIIDQSSNGTYVNGIRISQNVPVPVTRKDVISLAHVAKLDWSQVPSPNQWSKYVIAVVLVIVVVAGGILGYKHFFSTGADTEASLLAEETVDSTLIKQQEAQRLDSIKAVEQADSIKKAEEKARQDSIRATKKASQKKNAKKEDKPSKEKEDQSGKKSKRTIG